MTPMVVGPNKIETDKALKDQIKRKARLTPYQIAYQSARARKLSAKN